MTGIPSLLSMLCELVPGELQEKLHLHQPNRVANLCEYWTREGEVARKLNELKHSGHLATSRSVATNSIIKTIAMLVKVGRNVDSVS